ncbi:ankyrin repeat-containing domain protein [Lactifluus volemus]|nr:ankyrin repeat-containing domain protein [Lactifluus volemus]
MFRWVCCQLEMLRHCLPPSVRQVLGELPKSLDETYERVLREIPKTNRKHALRLLQCLVVASRPLRAQELAEVLAIDFDAAQQNGIPKLNLDRRGQDQQNAILTACSSLVTIVDDDVVQFSHFSVKQFLTSARLAHSTRDISEYHIALEPAHTTLAQACLAVLLQLDSHTDASDIPLLGYAARYWVDHVRFQNVSSRVRDAVEYFLDADKPHWPAWLRIYDMDQSWWAPYEMSGSPLYSASLCELCDLLEQLISKHPQDIIAEGGRMKTPLVTALYGKHFRIAELLHKHGASVDVRDDIGSTPLQSASNGGLVDVVQWLLDHGADVNSRDKTLRTSLHLASQRVALDDASHLGSDHDKLDIMRLLLEYGADVNAQDKARSTPLHMLCSHGGGKESSKAIRLLLDSGANIGAKNNEGKTALQLACAKGHYGIVELLLDTMRSRTGFNHPIFRVSSGTLSTRLLNLL